MGSRKFGSAGKTNKILFSNVDPEHVQKLAGGTKSKVDNIRRYGFVEKTDIFKFKENKKLH